MRRIPSSTGLPTTLRKRTISPRPSRRRPLNCTLASPREPKALSRRQTSIRTRVHGSRRLDTRVDPVPAGEAIGRYAPDQRIDARSKDDLVSVVRDAVAVEDGPHERHQVDRLTMQRGSLGAIASRKIHQLVHPECSPAEGAFDRCQPALDLRDVQPALRGLMA